MPLLKGTFELRSVQDSGDTTRRTADYGHRSDPTSVRLPRAGRGLSRKASEVSTQTELCERPVSDSPPPKTPERFDSDRAEVPKAVSHRVELIERLKRGESPTWIPSQHLGSLYQHERSPITPSPLSSPATTSVTLLPWFEIGERNISGRPEICADAGADVGDGGEVKDVEEVKTQQGLNIERPRSALQSGSFVLDESLSDGPLGGSREFLDDEQRTGGQCVRQRQWRNLSWIATMPPRWHAPYMSPVSFNLETDWATHRRRAFDSGRSSLLSPLRSGFAYKPPTSPLVHSQTNDDLRLTQPLASVELDSLSARSTRRHTVNVSSSSSSRSTLSATPAQSIAAPRSYQGLLYQAHQPRRSCHSISNLLFLNPSPLTSSPAFKRAPHSCDISPIQQHASMVGSYEESLVRGRMSTKPSQPLEFLAQIGVLGLGNCEASLRCPSHLTLPFQAVFYSYTSTADGVNKKEEGPSPYVGQIDLESGLVDPEEGQPARRKAKSRSLGEGADSGFTGDNLETRTATTAAKNRRASRPPKAPPGGYYRIPEKGQLQIMIKNQNKTAVKLFLVPYDLAGMEVGTKTFIRQRSCSAGSKVKKVPCGQKEGEGLEKAVLRYLVHLHICCPAKGRFYLYKSIWVVFANRVLDDKERLRNEVTFPEPRFSPYRAVRMLRNAVELAGSANVAGAGTLVSEEAIRRRSAMLSIGEYECSSQARVTVGVEKVLENARLRACRRVYWAHPQSTQTLESMQATHLPRYPVATYRSNLPCRCCWREGMTGKVSRATPADSQRP